MGHGSFFTTLNVHVPVSFPGSPTTSQRCVNLFQDQTHWEESWPSLKCIHKSGKTSIAENWVPLVLKGRSRIHGVRVKGFFSSDTFANFAYPSPFLLPLPLLFYPKKQANNADGIIEFRCLISFSGIIDPIELNDT